MADADLTAVTNLVDEYFRCNSLPTQLDALCALMTPDVVADYPSKKGITGIDAYRAHCAKTFKKMSATLRKSTVQRSGEVDMVPVEAMGGAEFMLTVPWTLALQTARWLICCTCCTISKTGTNRYRVRRSAEGVWRISYVLTEVD